MALRTALILNPHALGFRRHPELVAGIERAALGRAPVWVTQTRAALGLACAEMAAQSTEQVVVCGGDGTFMYALTALGHAFGPRPLPRLVLVPAGTVSTAARRLCGRVDPLGWVESALTGALPKLVLQPTLEVCEPDTEPRIGFTVGAGLVASFFERYDAAGSPGRFGAARIVARVLVGSLVGDRYARGVLDPVACTLEADGAELEAHAFSLIIASVFSNVGLGMRVTYRAGEDPGRPHLVASALPARKLGPQLWRVQLGMPLRGDGGFDGLVHQLVIKFPATGCIVLDGERLVASSVTVRAGPVIEVATR